MFQRGSSEDQINHKDTHMKIFFETKEAKLQPNDLAGVVYIGCCLSLSQFIHLTVYTIFVHNNMTRIFKKFQEFYIG